MIRTTHRTVALLLACLLPSPRLLALHAASTQNGNDPQSSSPSSAGPAQPRISPTDDAANNALWDKAQRMYAQNDFAQASAAANRITSPALKRSAQAMLSQIQAYVAALQEGVAAEGRQDPVAAIKAYATASHIKSDGPGDPNARITRVQQLAAAGQLNKEQQAKDKVAQRAAQHRARAVLLVKHGAAQEASGDKAGALASFQAAEAADPSNAVAIAAVTRLQAQPATSQATSPISPALAIRAFYAGRYAEAEQQLSALVATPGAQAQGAAWFYLGAARLYRALLDQGATLQTAGQKDEVRSAFHQSHVLGYKPLPRFVSPTLLELWRATS